MDIVSLIKRSIFGFKNNRISNDKRFIVDFKYLLQILKEV